MRAPPAGVPVSRRTRRIILAAGALLVLAAAGWLLLHLGVIGRAVDLAAEGGERELRSPMRPAGAGPRVLVFALDGVGERELLRALREGMAPQMAALLGADGAGGFAHAYAAPDVLSILPSTTIAAWTSLFTGEPPARTGVTGNEWFSRAEARFHAPAPVTVEDVEQALAVFSEDYLGARIRVPTLYERADVRSYVALSQVHRGADLLLVPDLGDLGELCPEQGQACDWAAPPRFDEDVMPVVRAFDAANRTGAHVPKLRGALDLILARQPVHAAHDALPFQVFDGIRLWPVEEYLEQHPRPDLPRLAERLHGLGAGPHGHNAGDIVLIAKSGLERPITDRFYFSSLYRSWHGSPTEQDSRIPLIVGRAGGSADEIRARVQAAVGERATQLDVTRLILALLERD